MESPAFPLSRIPHYPIQDAGKIAIALAEFDQRNSGHLDPKNKPSFRGTFELLRQKQERLTEKNERYNSFRTHLKIALNADSLQTQYEAFIALGRSQMSPMKWNGSNLHEAIWIEIACIYDACTPTNLTLLMRHLHPAFKDQHQKINDDLASEYREKMNSCHMEADQEYYQALCFYHSTIASKLRACSVT